MIINKIFRSLGGCLLLLFFLILGSLNQSAFATAGDVIISGITDHLGAPIAAGKHVQILSYQPGGSVLPPNADGSPATGNELIGESQTKIGGFQSGYNLDNTAYVFVRIWEDWDFVNNKTTANYGVYYGNSNPEQKDVKYSIPYTPAGFPTAYVIAQVTSITNSLNSQPSIGQGAKNVPVTITGNYFLTGAVVHFKQNGSIVADKITIVSKTITPTSINLVLNVTGDTLVGVWQVTVQNPAAIESNELAFTVNKGPHFTVSPTSAYQGDLKTLTLATTINGIFDTTADKILISPGTNISFISQIKSANEIAFNNFAISPNKDPGQETITVINKDGGQALAVFVVKLSSISLKPPPPDIYAGDVIPALTISGTGTHFSDQTDVTFTAPITYKSKSINGQTIVLSLLVPPSTHSGDNLCNAFTGNVNGGTESVSTALPVKLPAISVPPPANGVLGTNSDVVISGAGTHFKQGDTTISFGDNIAINTITVNSLTSLITNITIPPNLTPGPRNVTVTTTNVSDQAGWTETVLKTNGFTLGLPTIPSQVKNQRALADKITGDITLKWTNPTLPDGSVDPSYIGARAVYTKTFAEWNNITITSADDLIQTTFGKVDIPALANADTDLLFPNGTNYILKNLDVGETYYFKLFSYTESGGKQFFETTGVKVAAIPLKGTGLAPRVFNVAISYPDNTTSQKVKLTWQTKEKEGIDIYSSPDNQPESYVIIPDAAGVPGTELELNGQAGTKYYRLVPTGYFPIGAQVIGGDSPAETVAKIQYTLIKKDKDYGINTVSFPFTEVRGVKINDQAITKVGTLMGEILAQGGAVDGTGQPDIQQTFITVFGYWDNTKQKPVGWIAEKDPTTQVVSIETVHSLTDFPNVPQDIANLGYLSNFPYQISVNAAKSFELAGKL